MSLPTTTVRIIQDLPTRFLPTRPFKTKLKISKVQSLTLDLTEIIDKILKTNTDQDLQEKWTQIKKEPETHSLYCFHFRKRFKHPAIRGRLIYAFTFWNPFEMIKVVGRHHEMHGFFMDPPFQIHLPPTRDEWIKEMIDEQASRNKPVTKADIAFYKKAYKRLVDQRKWINIIWVPTWTHDGVLSIHNRISGFQSEVALVANVRKEITEVVTQHPVLLEIAKSQEAVETGFKKQLHGTRDAIKSLTQKAEEAETREKAKGVPIIYSPGHKTYPEIPVYPPIEAPKPTAAKILGGVKTEDILNSIPIGIGLFMLVGFAANPFTLQALGILGAILFITGLILYFWRKRTTIHIPIPEKVKEKAEEMKETAKEVVTGP